MRKLHAVLLPCIFFLTQDPAAAESGLERLLRLQRICPPTVSALERIQCMHVAIAAGEPCIGSVEERLACLESRVAKQARDIMWLTYELRKVMEPHLQLLEKRRLSQD